MEKQQQAIQRSASYGYLSNTTAGKENQIQNKHRILSACIIVCGLIYIFAYQFKLPFAASTLLYGVVAGLVLIALIDGRVEISVPGILFVAVAISAFIGLIYTTMPTEGKRETILFTMFAGIAVLSMANPALIRSFVKWVYLISIVIVLSSILQFIAPNWFNPQMGKIMRSDAYYRFRWSYFIDDAYAGLSAYTPNTTFSAAIVVGYSFLNLTNYEKTPIIKNKILNMVLLCLSMFCIMICSKRGIFVATLAAWVVLILYLYRGRNLFFKFVGFAVLVAGILVVLYHVNDSVAAFLDRFTGEDVLTGRDEIYESLLKDLGEGNLFLGRGTGATYLLAESGAHNIYLQILYDHGVFSVPYFILLIYNYYLAFKNKCPISIFVQTMFLVYGLSGNPLYSNMFMLIYIYCVLYAAVMQKLRHENPENPEAQSLPTM